MRKLLMSTAVLCSAGRNVPALAVIVLSSLGAGCANEPRQAGQAAVVQPAKVATIALAAPAVVSDDDPLECDYMVPAGTATHQWVCFTASQPHPVFAKDDDPLECQYAAVTGTMMHKWRCVTADEINWRGLWVP